MPLVVDQHQLRFGDVGSQGQRPLIMRHCPIRLAKQLDRHPDRVVSIGIVRLQAEGALVMGKRRFELSLIFEHVGEVDMRVGRSGIGGQRPADQIYGGLALSRLVGDHPEKLQRTGMSWIGRKDPPVSPFRLHEPARPMMSLGQRESFGNRCHRTEI